MCVGAGPTLDFESAARSSPVRAADREGAQADAAMRGGLGHWQVRGVAHVFVVLVALALLA